VDVLGRPSRTLLTETMRQVARLQIEERLTGTKLDTLRISTAQVALDCPPVHRIDMVPSKGASHYTLMAPNTLLLVDAHSIRSFITIYGPGGAALHAEGRIAVLADNRDVRSLLLIPDDGQKCPSRVKLSVVMEGADQSADTTPRTPLGNSHKNLGQRHCTSTRPIGRERMA